ncbi:putative membrane protein [Rivularia sp. PCC 7116]|uniref:DUF2231 domain-containing protein n=1 Tax=Rivularia sp. PCC 7116 TaxID=373994 RepID=UPI00029F0BC6|nr:DUF2231 domain-containing protein [Rivularia sp. PCC 7116]AFY55716.1 putative membrane protein [Rivularia sp. PCC 7116]
MDTEIINQMPIGANGLPYHIPIHPNLVHLTLGLFIIAITFDIAGVFFTLEKPIFKFLSIRVNRANFFDVGWYNIVASAIITFFTVAAGFYEIMLAKPQPDIKSAWGLGAMETMLWHGVGGVLLLAFIVGMAVWRGFQRFKFCKDKTLQVQLSYLLVGLVIMFVMYLHGTLGAHMAGEFGIHNTADNLLQSGQDPNTLLK